MITLQQYLNENLDINEGIKDSIKSIIKNFETKIKKKKIKWEEQQEKCRKVSSS